MCATCGCSTDTHEHDHVHPHDADDHGHAHDHADARLHKLEHDLLAKNDALAAQNRAFLRGRRALALNLVSSPGAGKTTLLERTLRDLAARAPVTVIEGDQATDRDAARIRATGTRVVQIETGKVCHLDAHMVAHALDELDPEERSVVMIENVGNLVCPALFDLGEHAKVVVFSVTEGEDKPLKYPHMFRAAGLVLLSKCDLLPHLDFDAALAHAYVAEVAPRVPVIRVSAKTGDGISEWLAWVEAARRATGKEAP